MNRFFLYRFKDESSVSGTDYVAEGIMFTGGKCAVSFLPGPLGVSPVAVYDSIEEVLKIHGHNGKTEIKWKDLADGEAFNERT